MAKSTPIYHVQQFHDAIIHSKNDHDLIEVMKRYISAVGGFGNAPAEVFKRLTHS